ncbi:MAG: YggS family pyridoxal phosphate enzyme [Bacteroidetes bacterium RIFCSPHIGHO2_02_FULL_44_7]|nr:MAG: YggS family pyridoxal phosphate enzyme [Bacteroidetes bacterium RIFCSPHIGHO2_02_FULL_44_7]
MICEQLHILQQELPNNVSLVAVSKTKPVADVQIAYDCGQRLFGENKVQEMVDKWEVLPKDIQWHMIGHLQSNKVKYIAPFVSMIHGVDSFKLLEEINKQAKKNDRVIPCLFQFHIAQEETKFGLTLDECCHILDSDEFLALQNVTIAGLMGMASFVDDTAQIRSEFRNLYDSFLLIKSNYFRLNDNFCQLSMGMSGDYSIAVDEGSTMVRIGSTIFGSR